MPDEFETAKDVHRTIARPDLDASIIDQCYPYNPNKGTGKGQGLPSGATACDAFPHDTLIRTSPPFDLRSPISSGLHNVAPAFENIIGARTAALLQHHHYLSQQTSDHSKRY